MQKIWLYRYAKLLAFTTWLLVIAGASVTSNQAGLSVPDWPLSYGKVMPEMKGGVFYEHGHRMIASLVGLLTIGLAVLVTVWDERRWMKRLAWVAVAAVVLQGVLGGLTVLFLLPKPVSMAHACLAQLFLSLTVALAIFTAPSWECGPQPVEDSGWPSLRSLAVLVPLLVLTQTALGAGFRHRAFGIVPHIIGALVVTLVVFILSVFVLTQCAHHRPLKRAAVSLLHVTVLQVLLGIAAYLVRLTHWDAVTPTAALVLMTVAHVGLGALTTAASVALSIQVFRHVKTVQPHAARPARALS